jgi:hypothetical protein
MSSEKIIRTFYNIDEKQNQPTSFFFLEHLLRARADLHMETGKHDYDQETNIYLAGLLNSLVISELTSNQKPYISPFDSDIQKWLNNHPGRRNEYIVYRDNAEFGLIFIGLFIGQKHPGSYQKIVLSDVDDQGRIALYYELAASALAHLQGRSGSLVNVFQEIADYLPEIVNLLRRTATTYFDLMERLSEGSLFHLEKEISDLDKKSQYETKLDDFLKTFSTYKKNPDDYEIRNKVIELADELKKINSSFRYDDLPYKE